MMRIGRPLLAILAVVSVSLGGNAFAQLPNAQLITISPPGGKQGTTVDVSIAGKDTDGANRLLFSHPGIVGQPKMAAPNEFLPPRPSPNQFAVQIAADVPPGVYDVYVVGKYGVSNPRSFVVGAEAATVEKEPNNDVATAMPVTLDTAVFGATENENFDVYKLSLKQGQRVVLNCQARRIDSRLDATLVMVDASGRELQRTRDVDHRDPVADFAAPADGDYFVRVHDHTYRGGDEYFYRLSISTGPYIDFAFPPCGQPGAKTRVTLYGRNLPGGSPAPEASIGGRALEKLAVDVDIPGDAQSRQALSTGSLVEADESGVDAFAYRLTSPQGMSNPVSIGFASAPVVLEQEPNNDAAHAQSVALPCEIAGQFQPRGDVDWYSFSAKKGDVYWIDVLAQRLGTSADPYVLIERVTKNDKGEQTVSLLQELDDNDTGRRRRGDGDNYRRYGTRSGDMSYRFQAADDGDYRIMIRDLYYRSRGNPRFVYRLAIRREQPDFRLVVVPTPDEPQQDQNAVPMVAPLLRKGGSVALDVVVFRTDGFAGEIDLAVAGLPAGVSAATAKVGENDNLGILTLVAEPTVADWVGEVTITGKATIAGAEVVRTARSGAVVTPAQNANERSRSRMASRFILSVTAAEAAPATVRAGDGRVWEMSRGGKVQIPVQVARNGEFKGAVNLQARGLPQPMGTPGVNVNADQPGANLDLTINPQVPPGVYCFHLQGQTPVANYRRNPEAVAAAQSDKQELDKIGMQMATTVTQAQQAKQAAEKAAGEAANAAKTATEAVTAADRDLQQAQQQAIAANTALANAKTAAAAKTDDQNLANAVAAAQKTADEAAVKAKTAGDKKAAAMQMAADAATKAQQSAEAKTVADKAATEAMEKTKRLDQAKQTAQQTLQQATQAANPKNVNVMLYSTPVILKITAAPVTVAVDTPSITIDPAGQVEAPITVTRLYGFNDEVEVDLVRENARGVETATIKIPAGQTQGKLVIKANKDAVAGDRLLKIEARVKYNGQNLQSRADLAVKVNEKAK